MDNIEYLEEYEDLIMPGGATEDRGNARDDESSSSIDQDIFESLFDDQSDDESEIIPKKIEEQGKRRQERESLDSLDMLVRDLGEQVNVKNDQQKCQSINESLTVQVNAALTKPITPCLKKSTSGSMQKNPKTTDGRPSSLEKPQKRVMFAKLPNVKRTSASSSSSSKAYSRANLEQHSTSGRKPIDNVKTASEANKSDFNNQRKLNRSQLTIVRPEKIQFKDPVDDPLSLEKVESDLESLSDISDDSFASLSDIFVTAQEPNENEVKGHNVDSAEISTIQNASAIASPPAHISTANLPEKVTIISDTVLSRIDTALLESLATNESKEVFSKDQKTKKPNSDFNNSKQAGLLEIIQVENSGLQDSDTNKIITVYEKSDQCGENTLVETSTVSEEMNDSNLSEEIEKINTNSIKSPESQSEIFDNIQVSKNLDKKNDNIVEKESNFSKDTNIDSSAEKSKEGDINFNIPDIPQTTDIENKCLEPSVETQSNITAEKEIGIDLKEQAKVETKEIVSKGTLKSVSVAKEPRNSENPEKTDANKSEKEEHSQVNRPEKSSLSQAPKKEQNVNVNQKDTSKKVNVDKSEAKKVDQITTQPITSTPKEHKTIPTQSRSQDKCKEVSKEQSKITLNQSQKVITESSKKESTYKVAKKDAKYSANQSQAKEQTSKERPISKSVSESPKKEPEKTSASGDTPKQKNIQKVAPAKEKDTSGAQKNVAIKDVSSTPSSSTKNPSIRPANNQSKSAEQNSSKKYEGVSVRKSQVDIVPKQSTPKSEQIESSKSKDIQRFTKPSRENSNVSTSSEEKNRNSTNSKEKLNTSTQQKTTPQTQRKIEAKEPTSKNIRNNPAQKNDEKKSYDLNKSVNSPAKKESSKKAEVRSQLSTRAEEIKNVSNTDTKIENKKVTRDAESTMVKKVDEVGLKTVTPEGRNSKEHADNKQTQSSIQKDKTQYEKKVEKTPDSKSDNIRQREKSSVNSPVKKDATKLKADLTPNANNEKSKRIEGVKPSVKRQNSMTKIDNNSTKRLRSTSNSADDTGKPNTPNESDISRNNKKEQTKSSKPSSSKIETDIPKLLSRKSSDSDIKRKDESSKKEGTNQIALLETSEKDHGKSPFKKSEITSTSKAGSGSTLTPKQDKTKLQNEELKNKSGSSTSSSVSTNRNNKTPGKNNSLSTSVMEVSILTKKPNVPTSPMKKPKNDKETTYQQSSATSVKNTAIVTKEKPPLSSSSDNMGSKDKKTSEDSTSVDAMENKIAQKSLTPNIDPVATSVSQDTRKNPQPIQAVDSSTFAKATEKNKSNTEDTKSVTNTRPSNQQNLSSDSNANKEQHTIEQNKSKPRLSNKKQEKKTLSGIVLGSESKVEATETNRLTSLETTNTSSRGKEQVENIENTTDAMINVSEELKGTEQPTQEDSVEVKNSKTTTKNIDGQDPVHTTSTTSNTENIISSKDEKEVTDSLLKNNNATKNMTEHQSSNEAVEKAAEANNLNVSLRKRTSATEQKNNTENLEQTASMQKNSNLETGKRRQLRKRGIETLAADESESIASKISTDKGQAEKISHPSKPEEKQTKRERTRKSRRGRETEISETELSLDVEAEKNKPPSLQNLENQQNDEANSKKKLSDQAEPMNENTLPLESETDQAVETMNISTEEQRASSILNKEHKEPMTSEMDTENQLLHDNKLDNLSMTSVESAVFSGFTDSPVNMPLNEKLIDLSLTASKAAQDSNASKDTHAIESSAPSPSQSKTVSEKAVSSAVITFNEWLARKNMGQSGQEKVIEGREDMETGENDSARDGLQISDSNKELNSAGKKDDSKLSELAKTSSTNPNPKPNPKPPKPKKSELDILKESMSKEMRESGIDMLIESHFSSPHCLTKRSIAARYNTKATSLTSPKQKVTIKTRSPATRAPTPAKKLVSTNIPVNSAENFARLAVNRKRTRNAHKDERHPVKQAPLPPKCRNLYVRLNRSVVRSYLKNLEAQALNATNSSQKKHSAKPHGVSIMDTEPIQTKAKGNKRKATRQADGPAPKKALIAPPLDQSIGKSTTAASPQTPTQSRAVRSNNSSRAKIMTISPRGRCAPSAETDLATVETPVSSQSTTNSQIKSDSTNKTIEAELLTPVSVSPALATSTESSRRATTKRSTTTTTTATNLITATSDSGKVPRICSPILAVPKPTQSHEAEQQSALLPKPTTPTTSSVAPKTECEDEYDAVYRQATQQALQSSQTPIPSVGPSSSRISPLLTTDARANVPAVSSTVPLVISGATSHSLPPISIDNAGTRIYSFLHPTKYNNSHGYVMLDYCCPNLDGPMTAIDPTRRHAKVDVAVRELPAYITMETRLVTRAELEADSSALPASIRQKVQRITGSKGPAAKASPCISSTITTNFISANVTSTTTVAPKATSTSVSNTSTSTSMSNVSAVVSASVSALQKQLPSTTTLTPKTMSATATAATYKTTPGSTSSGAAPTATITPTTQTEMRLKLCNNLKKYDILLKKHYPRISLLSYNQRQEIIEALAYSTQLLPRDIETATRLLQEYVTHMALKTATKPQPSTDLSAPSTSSAAAGTVRATPTITAAISSATGASVPPVTTRANSKRTSTTPSNFQRRSVPIYNSDKTVIGYQVQMVTTSNAGTTTSLSSSSTSTRRVTKSNTAVLSTSTSSTTTRRSGVFVIDKPNLSAPTTPLMTVSNTVTPRMLYQKPNLRTPTSIATMAHAPQASSTPLSSSDSIVTRSGGTISRIGRGITVRQLPTRAATTKMHSPATVAPPVTITTTSASSFPRLPTLTRNPHLPPLSAASQPTTPITVRNMPGINVSGDGGVGMEHSTFQKRLTRKTAAASVAELLVVNHDSLGNPLPTTEESILPDESNATSATHIKSEKPDEF